MSTERNFILPDPRFEFYEEVQVRSPDKPNRAFIEEIGVVLGRTRTEDMASWYYTVGFVSKKRGWCFYERELEATGRRFRREDFYDGSTVRVRVREDEQDGSKQP